MIGSRVAFLTLVLQFLFRPFKFLCWLDNIYREKLGELINYYCFHMVSNLTQFLLRYYCFILFSRAIGLLMNASFTLYVLCLIWTISIVVCPYI
jgi:hypothetical protein